jgi:hypothetical protein
MVECLPSKQKTWVRFPQLVFSSFPGEMVDTLDLKSDAARRNGSSPLGSSFIKYNS